MMFRAEQKSEAPKTVLQLLEEHVSYVLVRHEHHRVEFYFDEAHSWAAYEIADKLENNIGEKNKQFILHLSKAEVNALWGRKSYHVLKQACWQFYSGANNDDLRKMLLDALKSHPALYPILARLRHSAAADNALVYALINEPQEACLKLTHGLSKAALKLAINVRNDSGNLDRFIFLLTRAPSDTGMILLDVISDRELDEMLRLHKSGESSNGFEAAMSHSSPSVCIKLIDRISTERLNAALQMKDARSKSAFQNALDCQPAEVCIKLIDRADSAVVDKLLEKLLPSAAHHQTENVFIALIEKASPYNLAVAAFQSDKENDDLPIEVACQYQTASSMQAFFQRLSSSLSTKAAINHFFMDHAQKLLDCFWVVAMYQTAENANAFLSLLNDGRHLHLRDMICRKMESYTMRAALRALQYKINDYLGHREEQKSERNLPTLQFLMPSLSEALLRYDQSKSKDEKKLASYSERDKNALTLFSAGAFVKVIRDDEKNHHSEFVTHLFHPKIRHAIRILEKTKEYGYKLLMTPLAAEVKKEHKRESKTEQPPDIYYSYPGGFPNIIKVRDGKQRAKHKKKKPPHTHSTKYPVTYVSKNLFTGLFGAVSGREVVAYAFTVNPDNIKMLSTQDCGTYTRWWYGVMPSFLLGQANHNYNLLCRTFAEFVKRVDEQPYVVNEVLVKLCALDLFAIVIGKDTPKARQIAVERRLELRRLYSRDLPILFYYPEERKAVPYASYHQSRENCALFLTELQQDIQKQLNTKSFLGLFSSTPSVIQVDFKDKTYQLDARLANVILEIIKTKNPESAFFEVEKTLPVLKKQTSALSMGKVS